MPALPCLALPCPGLQAWGPMSGSARRCMSTTAALAPCRRSRCGAVDAQGGACRQCSSGGGSSSSSSSSSSSGCGLASRHSAATAGAAPVQRHHCCTLLQLRKIVADNFSEWGPLENVHLVPAKTLAFIRQAGMPEWRARAAVCATCVLLPPRTAPPCSCSRILLQLHPAPTRALNAANECTLLLLLLPLTSLCLLPLPPLLLLLLLQVPVALLCRVCKGGDAPADAARLRHHRCAAQGALPVALQAFKGGGRWKPHGSPTGAATLHSSRTAVIECPPQTFDLSALPCCAPLCPAVPCVEVLDVRWANDDPNPRAVARVQYEREDALRNAYVKVGGWLGWVLWSSLAC